MEPATLRGRPVPGDVRGGKTRRNLGRGNDGYLVGARGLTHVHGRAGDFWAPGFLDEADGANATAEEERAAKELHAKFALAARAAGGRCSAFGQDGTHKDHIHIFW